MSCAVWSEMGPGALGMVERGGPIGDEGELESAAGLGFVLSEVEAIAARLEGTPTPCSALSPRGSEGEQEEEGVWESGMGGDVGVSGSVREEVSGSFWVGGVRRRDFSRSERARRWVRSASLR